MRFAVLLMFACLTAAASAQPDSERVLADIRALTGPEMQGRASGTDGAKRARQWIASRFAAIGLIPAADLPGYFHRFSYGRARRLGVNVVATLPGCEDEAQRLVATAHYDHLGQRAGRTYHGADDNASGVAAMLWLAERLAAESGTQDVCWWFVATDAEESGLHGSEALFETSLLSPESVISNLNLDMIARGEKRWRLHLSGTRKHPSLREKLDSLALKLRLDHVGKKGPRGLDSSVLDNNWYAVSDHGPFVDRDLAHVFIGGMDHADYHEPTDRWQAIDVDYLSEVLRVIATTADWLSQPQQSPD